MGKKFSIPTNTGTESAAVEIIMPLIVIPEIIFIGWTFNFVGNGTINLRAHQNVDLI